ncbi:exporters of the RND superfamily [gamma proteobacterium HTCC5015]|nr:exporters of the RND superfamily [gamma proteobacterium HTCC5015]
MLGSVIRAVEGFIFSQRKLVIAVFAVLTVLMAASATRLEIKAGFEKLLPLEHEYMQTYLEHRDEFGGGNRILIALMAKDDTPGSMFTGEYLTAFDALTNLVYAMPGIEKAKVKSIFTPNVRFTEITEDGIDAGNVIPPDYDADDPGASAEKIRKNILKANIVGRLVANDFTGAAVSAHALEVNPETQEPYNQVEIAQHLSPDLILQQIEESVVASGHSFDASQYEVRVIGFTKVVGDITEGAGKVVLFFAVAFLITAILVYLYSQSWKVTIVPLVCSVTAVIWQLGILPLIGFGIDPMSILVPFLIFAIGVSHGVQMISAIGSEVFNGKNMYDAARKSFRVLAVPGGIALASDTIGFITILLIDIGIIQEMAITASLGVAVIILTNLILLPVLMSFLPVDDNLREKLKTRSIKLDKLWTPVSAVTEKKNATLIVLVMLLLFAVGYWKGQDVQIGDLHQGVPELRADSEYNRDTAVITDKFSIGVDVLTVMAETKSSGCSDYNIMTSIDRFAWHMQNVEGVQTVGSLPQVVKVVNAAWNEGYMKWRELPRNQFMMNQSSGRIDTTTGLLNKNCSVMPVYIFTEDHKAQTINRITDEVKAYNKAHGHEDLSFELASGNVGVMAATNEEVSAAQFNMLVYVFGAVILMCLITFRSLRGTLCIVIPLALVSLLAYALMSLLEIGLKVNTLPVVALGVGIGVDYGIYIFSRFQEYYQNGGHSLKEAYHRTLSITGNGVVFTGLTLGIGVATWIFSPLKFQADMGILLTFMFVVNMLGAIFILPALARLLYRER